MKYLNEYRDADLVRRLADQIRRETSGPWKIMEVCGGQTHSIVKYGIDQLLPPGLELIHGPGCPVCVTSISMIDRALDLASDPKIIFCSFGDMLRVPGTNRDLLGVRSAGGDVRMVYSPLDALKLARAHPNREIEFFAVGFETTAPSTALAVRQAHTEKIGNFSILAAHVTVPPAIEALLSAPDCGINGFLAAGHVCAVMGYREYPPLAKRFKVPLVVTGFEPVDLLRGVLSCVRQLERGEFRVENQYGRCVRSEGNPEAIRFIREVYRPVDRCWRGIGIIPGSGLALRSEYEAWDAGIKFGLSRDESDPESECMSGLVLRGRLKPDACPAFGKQCAPEHPLGAPMVSTEGACAAYFRYRYRSQLEPGRTAA
jgi:hydrogenase expression/formation protein HypD